MLEQRRGGTCLTVAVTEAREAGKTRWALWLGIGLGVLLVARLILLRFNATDLFFDEAQYWTWSLEPAFGYYSKPPLIAWLIGASNAICGTSEFCIRLPAPILHTATAVVVFALGARLYDQRIGFWSALAFATLPGVSVSSGIMSTDVPLLLCWALALYAFVALLDTPRLWPAVLLGAALGIGFNAKYAMLFFVLSAAVYLALAPERRWLLRDRRLYIALALAALLIAPNVIWNATNSFATVAHTADNANWGGSLANPGKALEFLGAQFGVFGPILFGALIWVTVLARRGGIPAEDRLLLCFTLPVLAVVAAQAFLSRAHANWAAVAYVAATILVTAAFVRSRSWGWLKASFALHLVVLIALGMAVAYAGRFSLPLAGDPFARTLGWKEIAAAASEELENGRRRGMPYGSVITDERALTAELLYYMRSEPTPVLAWRRGSAAHDHYELTRPFSAGSPEPVLLVGLRQDVGGVLDRFAKAEPLGSKEIAAGLGKPRTIRFFRLTGFKGGG
jgi:4-amino-4-deoxy-L-arabinose transferase-like glycosyltransferase